MSFVTLTDVGPRDGLQNQPLTFSADLKVKLINLLYDAGLPCVEIGSFVPAQWVQAMANTSEVAEALSPLTRKRSLILVPNGQGFERSLPYTIGHLSVIVAASERFSQRNTNRSIQESFEQLSPVIHQAKALGIPVRGYISCVWGCPYEGAVSQAAVEKCVGYFVGHDIAMVVLSDTIGVATPGGVRRTLKRLKPYIKPHKIGLHFHDTYGQALANILTALDQDITAFDTSIGGLGGCPYAKGATGNVATEDVLYMLQGLGVSTGVHEDVLLKASRYVRDNLGLPLHSKVALAKLALEKNTPS